MKLLEKISRKNPPIKALKKAKSLSFFSKNDQKIITQKVRLNKSTKKLV